MFKRDEVVLYGLSGVCHMEAIVEKEFKGEMRQYYLLRPLNQLSSSIFVPFDNPELMARIKKLLTKHEIHDLIDDSDEESDPWINHDHTRRENFKLIIKNGERKDMMGLIDTIFIHEKLLKTSGKKLNVSDQHLLSDAKKMLHDEFAYVLNIENEDVGMYIENWKNNKTDE